MARRKKHPRLPNGFGSIKYLGKGRRNCYGVYPPAKEINEETGNPITPPAICYVDDWMKGFMVLTAYKAGTYTPGYELTLNLTDADQMGLEELSRRILADYGQAARRNVTEKTFAEVYKEFYQDKYYNQTKKVYSESSKRNATTSFKHCAPLYSVAYSSLRHADFQSVVDNSGMRHAGQEQIVTLLHQMAKYALKNEIVDRDYTALVTVNIAEDDEPGIPFSDAELEVLWTNQDDPVIEFILIMCYTGFRITAYLTMEVNLEHWYLKGGIKTKKRKDRIVPIHSGIQCLVTRRIARDGALLTVTTTAFRTRMKKALERIGLPHHTPHDCRHTFSRLTEKYDVRENDRKRLLGHTFPDITNRIYGHREIEELRAEVEKIQIPAPKNCC